MKEQEWSKNHVWVPSATAGKLFEMAQLKERNGSQATVEILETNKTRQVSVMDVLFMNPPSMNNVDDVLQLTHVNEPCVLHHLKSRFSTAQNVVLTECGGAVWLSQFKKQDQNHHTIDDLLHQKQNGALKLSNYLLNHCKTLNEKQTVLLMGDSGSGKTLTSKLLIKSLINLSPTGISCKVMNALRVLDVFSSSTTEQSKETSRVSKNISLSLDKTMLTGLHVECYNLEMKRSAVRVMEQLNSENDNSNPGFINNFNVFYQLVADQAMKTKFKLTEVLKHDLKVSEKLYGELQHAMSNVGFTESQMGDVTKILSSILHILNCKFIDGSTDACKLEESSQASFKLASKLLGVDEQQLINSLTKPKIIIDGTIVESFANVAEATYYRDVLVMSLYNGLFEWITNQINLLLKPKEGCEICIVDIGTGFESIAVGVDAERGVTYNGLEQLLVNYANEKVRQLFLDQTLIKEQDFYVKEGIEWKMMNFDLNSNLVNLLEDSTDGFFETIRQQTLTNNGDESNIIRELSKTVITKPEEINKLFKPNLEDLEFTLSHYNGKVTYRVTNWYQDNVYPISSMSSETMKFLKTSKNTIVQGIYDKLLKEEGIAVDIKKKETQLTTTIFRNNLEKLIQDALKTSKLHTVCCLRAYTTQTPSFSEKLMVKQLRSYGILDVLRLPKKGYMVHIPVEKFVTRFESLASDKVKQSKEVKEKAKAILEPSKDIQLEDYKIGSSCVMLKSATESLLNTLLAK